MGQTTKESLLQNYPLPKNPQERTSYTALAYFMFLVLCAISILLTKYFLF